MAWGLATLMAAGTVSAAGALSVPAAAVARPATASPAAAPGAGSGQVSEETASAEARRTGKNVEVTSLRGESRDVFATPDGALEAREYLRPVRTRVDGEWRSIDTTLTPTKAGMVSPKAASVGLAFSGGGDGPLVRMERAGRTLELSWRNDLPAPTLDGDTATYPDVLPDVDLRLAARPEGFTQLLVVKSAEAAKSTELAQLRLQLAAKGLAVRETTSGGLEAVDKGAGGVVFEAPTPVMWDSSPGGQSPASAQQSTASSQQAATGAGTAAKSASAESMRDAAEAESAGEEPGAGESGRLEPVGVDIAPGGGELVLTPDRGILTDPETVYPVFIDPQWYTPKASAWTMASRYWASSPQWKFNGNSDAGLGYCGWSYCAPYDVKRLFYRIPTTKFAGRTILSAEFVVRETHAASCENREVQLWRTKGISSSTTWNSQDSSDFWLDHIQTRSFAHGYDGCASADAEFDVKGAVATAAAKNWPDITFGMRASNESDRYTWKRFSDDAFLRVKYNRPPPRIGTSQLTMDPGGPCVKSDKMVRIRSAATVRANDVTDPDGDPVSVQFQASWDAGDGGGWKARWTSATTTSKKSGSDFSMPLPSSIPKNKHADWHVRSWDGAQWSPWSWQNANGCHFMYDTAVPAGPSITSAQYPPSDVADPDDPWWDGVGRYGTFTIDSSSSDVSKYWFGINTSPSSAHTLTTSGGGAKTMSFMPTKPGVNFITAQAFDAAGNGSEPRTYTFRVRAGQPDRLSWQMDETSGMTSVAGAGGAWPAELRNGAATGGEGASGTGLALDGTDDYAASSSPVLNTAKSFSVSLWAKLPSDKPDAATTALSQPGQHRSGFELYHSSAVGGWVFLRHSTDSATGTEAIRATQPACASGDTACAAARLGTWTHVVGVFDYPSQLLKLYIDGKLVGTAPITTNPWDARGGTILGAASHEGTVSSFFPGSLDDVQLFDYQLNEAQVTRLAAKQPVDTNRPAKLVWPLDEAVGATSVTGRAQAADAVLRGGAAPGVTGVNGRAVTFDGVDDYATTGRPVLNTFHSFAVAAWVRLPKDKEARAMAAVTQEGGLRRGFELYHSSALGGWVFSRPESDTADAPLLRATQTACQANTNCAAGRFGEWNHVVGVYDSDASKIRLYVNGVLQASTAFTSQWLSTGPVVLGSGLTTTGGVSSTLKGDMDDVRLYDRAVSDDEVRQLFKQRPLVNARWKFESATGSPAVAPDASAAGVGMTLNNGAAIGSGWVDGGVTLDGVNDYAATASGKVTTDTSASFTISAFAQAAAQPTGSVSLLSAPGTNKNALAIRYVPSGTPDTDAGRWRIEMAEADTTDAAATRVDNRQFYSVQDWNHLAVVYDGFAHEARLYVNGQLEQVSCVDADANGEPDVVGCADADSSAENVLTFPAVQNLQLGRAKTGTSTWGEYWPGAVSDLWTFQGALTDTQISHLARGLPGTDTTVPSGD
ncbi:LamG-like jellyroll fold domain-containing protein [Streptomyces sp. NPDC020681]|uniref:LamG domain-containing protein n=1 Tax=Streptomyces sp. NPDC020681 TaxID=3365083 RepID=UPI00379C37A9